MILTNAQRIDYLRGAVALIDGIPLLMERGRPDQVLLELDRVRADVEAVRRSLIVQGAQVARELMG